MGRNVAGIDVGNWKNKGILTTAGCLVNFTQRSLELMNVMA